jgi:Ca2+-binding RTX toxin-like protein
VYNAGANNFNMDGIETLTVNTQTAGNGNAGYSYNIAVTNADDPDAGTAANETLTVDASSLLADADTAANNVAAEVLTFTASVAQNLTTNFKVHVTGGAAADNITGGALADTLIGGDGNDQLTGGAGVDDLRGGNGNDIINGDDGNDIILGGAGADTISGGDGNDSIEAGAGLDQLTGGNGADTFVLTSTAAADADTITDFDLGAGGDTLQLDLSDLGLAGSDVFLGAAHQVDATGSQEIVVLNFASYASDADAAAAVADSVTTDGNAVVIVYHRTDGAVRVIHVTNSNTGTGVSHIATLDVAAGADTLADLATAVAGNFGGRP